MSIVYFGLSCLFPSDKLDVAVAYPYARPSRWPSTRRQEQLSIVVVTATVSAGFQSQVASLQVVTLLVKVTLRIRPARPALRIHPGPHTAPVSASDNGQGIIYLWLVTWSR